MLKIKDVSVKFSNQIIGPFNAEVTTNQIVAIIGASGAGKSTLVKAITNTIEYEGSIIYNDHKITPDLFMYITQKGTLFGHLSIRENLMLSRYDEQEAIAIFEDLNIPREYLDKYPFELSGGECQRIDLTRAILARTQILILDEAFSALDSKTKDDTYVIIKALQQKYKMLVLFITHDLQESVFLSKRILLIHDGKIEFDGSNKELLFSNNYYVNELISKEKMELLRGSYANS